MPRAFFLALLVILVGGACLPLPRPSEQAVLPPPKKVLFIGNSLTYWNMGVDEHLKTMAAMSDPPLIIETKAETIGGAVLKENWDSGTALNTIREGDWDAVVLQEDIPELYRYDNDIETFYAYARQFDQEIGATGAQTYLYMTWAYPRLGWIDTDGIVDAHRQIADELGAGVAPVGLAWKRAEAERPDLNLYDRDGEHPSILGTFLTVNVLYAMLFGQSPVGHAYRPADIHPDPDTVAPAFRGAIEEQRVAYAISEEDAEFLQRIAWETVQEYQAE